MPAHNDENGQEDIYAMLVEIIEEPIELYKVLKIGNLVSGGGEAKQVISEGYVFLNGQEETQKRKKVYAGDLIQFNGEYLQVALKGYVEQYEVVESPAFETTSHNTKPFKSNDSKAPQSKPMKRKPISF